MTLSALLCSPAFTFPHPLNPVAYQQILSQQRSLGSAFGHTPPLIQPSPTFLAQQPMALASINATPTQLSSSSNCLSDASQVCGCRSRGWAPRCSSGPPEDCFCRELVEELGTDVASGQRPCDPKGLGLHQETGARP